MRRWAFGEYTIGGSEQKTRIAVSGALGLAAWRAGMTSEQLFVEADRAMYAEKARVSRRQ